MYEKTVLITGGAGFIGSNFVEHFSIKHPSYKLIVLDKLTYAGTLDNLSTSLARPSVSFIKGDICDKDLINSLFAEHNIDSVIHFAAESHVDNSISGPEVFIKTNIEGTFSLLETARRFWQAPSFKEKQNNGLKTRFHHISTDEVYGSLGETGAFTETTPYAPNSPYSASKASSDFLARSYFHTYGIDVVTTNCSNNYGPKQHWEKLIPVIIKRALQGEDIPIYGDGKNIRDWLYVADHCEAIDVVFHAGSSGETYNVGGNEEKTNLQVVHTICDHLDRIHPKEKSYKEQISFVKDRPGHDRRYAINATKIRNQLGWQPKSTFETGIERTIDWYMKAFMDSANKRNETLATTP